MFKKLILLSILSISLQVYAGDVLTLTNGKSFEGKVVKIKKNELWFQVDSTVYYIPASDVGFVHFVNPNHSILKRFERLDNVDNTMKGKLDAELYHGKTGLHIALGTLFGPFAVIGAAIANPKPSNGKNTYIMSENKDLFSDPAYLEGYRKRAKGKNVGNTAIGWGIWMLFVLLL